MISIKNIFEQMFVEAKECLDPFIQQNRDLQRSVFIAAYEDRPIQPVPEGLVTAGSFIAGTVGITGLQYIDVAPTLPLAMVCAGGFGLTNLAAAKLFNRIVHEAAHQPVNKHEVIQGDHVNNLAEALVLGEYCHRSRNPDHVRRALSGVEGAGLLGPVELTSIIDIAAYPAEARRLPRGPRSLLKLNGWH